MNAIMTTNFHGHALYGVRIGDQVFVAPKPIVEAMGLQWAAQLKRIKRDPVLSGGMSVMDIPSKGGSQETVALRLDLIPGWLFTISVLRIKDEAVRAKIILFQRECYAVLAEHFLGKQKPRRPGPDAYERWSYKLAVEARLLGGIRAGAEMWMMRGLPRTPTLDALFAQIDLFTRNQVHEAGPLVPDSPSEPTEGSELARIAGPRHDKSDGKE